MKRFLFYCLPIFILIIIHGCKKEDDPSYSSYLYKVTLDENERVVKVVEYDINNSDTTGIPMTIDYYNDSIIQIIFNPFIESTSNEISYYLNGEGLSDSINDLTLITNTESKFKLEYNGDKLSQVIDYVYELNDVEPNPHQSDYSKFKYSSNILDSIYYYSLQDSLKSCYKVFFTDLPNKLKISFLGPVYYYLSGYRLIFSCSAFGSQESFLVSEIRYNNSRYIKFNYKLKSDGYLEEMTENQVYDNKLTKTEYRFEYIRLNK